MKVPLWAFFDGRAAWKQDMRQYLALSMAVSPESWSNVYMVFPSNKEAQGFMDDVKQYRRVIEDAQ